MARFFVSKYDLILRDIQYYALFSCRYNRYIKSIHTLYTNHNIGIRFSVKYDFDIEILKYISKDIFTENNYQINYFYSWVT